MLVDELDIIGKPALFAMVVELDLLVGYPRIIAGRRSAIMAAHGAAFYLDRYKSTFGGVV